MNLFSWLLFAALSNAEEEDNVALQLRVAAGDTIIENDAGELGKQTPNFDSPCTSVSGRNGLKVDYFEYEEMNYGTKLMGYDAAREFQSTHLPKLVGLDKQINHERDAGNIDRRFCFPQEHCDDDVCGKKTDYFNLRWTGSIQINQSGHYRFWVENVHAAFMVMDGTRVINKFGAGPLSKTRGGRHLDAGRHDIEMIFVHFQGPYGIKWSYSGPDTNNMEVLVPEKVLFQPPCAVGSPGLKVEYFEWEGEGQIPVDRHGIWQYLLDADPKSVGVAAQINLPQSHGERKFWEGAKDDQYFHLRYTGFINITNSGVYRFSLESDDAAWLSLDKKMLIDNEGHHGMGTKTKHVSLATGMHRIMIQYTQSYDHWGIILRYRGPDSNNNEIVVPPGVLYQPGNGALFMSSNEEMLDEDPNEAIPAEDDTA